MCLITTFLTHNSFLLSVLFILMLNNFANIKKNQFDKFFFEQLDGDYF